MSQSILITGFPTSFLANRVLQYYLEQDTHPRLTCIVQPKAMNKARQWLKELSHPKAAYVHVMEGDVASLDLGLSGAEFSALAAHVELIHHCAAVSYPHVPRRTAELGNVQGAKEILELALETKKLERLVLWSTTSVFGTLRGTFMEAEPTQTPAFRNVVEETRFRAEKILLQARTQLPLTVLRTPMLVGDSTTGHTDRMEGLYWLIAFMLKAHADLRIPLPSHAEEPLNVVPIDYAVKAGCAMGSHPNAASKIFHLVDPQPFSVRKTFELFAQLTGCALGTGHVPTGMAQALLRTPGLRRFVQTPRTFLEQLTSGVRYDTREAVRLTSELGIACPSLQSYAPVLVEYVRNHPSHKQKQKPKTDGR